MTRWFSWVLRHRALVLTLTALITVAAGWSTSRAVIASSVGKLFLGESPEFQHWQDVGRTFANDEVIVLGWEEPEPLSAAALDRLAAASALIEAEADVHRVDSLLTAQRMESDGGALRVESFVDLAREDPARAPALLREMIDDPVIGGLLVSRTGTELSMSVELTVDATRPAESVPAFIEHLYDLMEQAGYERAGIRGAGLQVQFSGVIAQTNVVLVQIFPLTILGLLLTVWLLFRRLWPAAISTFLALLGVVWTMGFAVALDPHINVLFAIVPAVIMIVAFSDIVHLCSAYLLELGKGRSKDEAILASAEDVGRACLFTSLTTFVGFVSLALIPTPVFRHLGIVLGCGVAIALLQAMTLGPLLFSLLPQPKPLREGTTGKIHDVLDRLLGWSERIATGHPRAVIAGFLVLTAIAGVGVARLNVETDFADRLNADHPVRVDQDWFLRHFDGTHVVDIYLTAPARDGLLDDAVWDQQVAFHERLEGMAGIDQVTSLVPVMKTAHAALVPDSEASVPRGRRALAQYLLLFETGGGQDLERLLDFDRQRTRVAMRLSDGGVRAIAEAGNEAKAIGEELFGEGVEVRPTGMSFLMGDWLDEILTGQRNSLIASFFLIAVMMAVALRGVRVGIASMLPNLLPLLCYGGFLGLFWESVDSDGIIVAILAIGIGVDDTIHFLVRYRIERERTADRREAIRRTFAFAGRAIVMTTVILVVGFLPFAWCDYLSLRMLGWFLPLALIVAMLADLLLVPAMLTADLGLDVAPRSN